MRCSNRLLGRIGLVLLLGFILAGCSFRQRVANYSAELDSWLEKQTYSSWETYRGPQGELPRKPEGMTLGNRHIFAGIGCNEKDLSEIAPLYGDRKSVRGLPAELRFAVEVRGEKILLAQVPEQSLRRISRTAIVVGENDGRDYSVTTVDFAPMEPEVNCLARLVIVRNEGDKGRFGLSFAGTLGELEKRGRALVTSDGRLGLLSDHELKIEKEAGREIRIDLGEIEPQESRAVGIYFVPAQDEARLEASLEEVEAQVLLMPLSSLEATRISWAKWSNQAVINSGNARLDDLIDGLLCLMKSHVGFEGIHTGSLRYPHNRAWVRDNYWVGRALWEAGLMQEAQLNLEFFYSAWEQGGICSYYNIETRKGEPYGNLSVELPHYLVLMVKDAEEMGGIEGKRYWPMVKDCLDKAKMVRGGLQPINGDETWLLAAGIDQMYYVLDNAILLIKASEYGARLAAEMGDEERAERYARTAKSARHETETMFWAGGEAHLASARDGSSGYGRGLDLFPNAGVMARAAIFDIIGPSIEGDLNSGEILRDAYFYLGYGGGIRSYSRSAVMDGGTPGYFLYAATEAGLEERHLIVRGLLEKFCSATGSVWELQSATNPKWGLEKRRLWDSAVVLMGLLRYCKAGDVVPAEAAAEVPATRHRFRAEEVVVLQEKSAAHARLLATDLARHFGKPIRVGEWKGDLPKKGLVVVVSPEMPKEINPDELKLEWEDEEAVGTTVVVEPETEEATAADTAVEPAETTEAEAAPQARPERTVVWVKNRGNAFEDVGSFVYRFLRGRVPQREPAAYPDADLALAEKIGEIPSGTIEVKVESEQPVEISCGGRVVKEQRAEFSYDLGAGISAAPSALQIKTIAGADKIVSLTVSARGGPEAKAKVEVIVPVGYWVVEARGYGGGWDRTVDTIDEVVRADGRRAFIYEVGLGEKAEKSFTLKLARPLTIPFS